MIEAIAEKKPAIKSFKRKAQEPIGIENPDSIHLPSLSVTPMMDNIVPFKSFEPLKFSTSQQTSVSIHTDLSPQNADPTKSFMADLEAIIETQNQTLQKVTPSNESGNIISFPVARVIDWNEDKGRFALAENFLKTNETQFVAMRQRMQMMADADGCGGVNERGGSSTGNLFGNNKSLASTGISKILGQESHKHKEGKHGHCDNCGSDLDDGKCGKCAA